MTSNHRKLSVSIHVIMKEHGCFSYQIFCLKTSAIWPLQTKNKFIVTIYHLYTIFTCVLLSIISVGLIGATFFSSDLKNISSTVDIATLTLSALFKLGFMKIHMKKFKRLVAVMENKFKKTLSNRYGNLIDVTTQNRNSATYSTLLIGSGIVVGVFWNLAPIIENTQINKTGAHGRQFPLTCWIPFDVTWSPMYEIIYFFESVAFFLGIHIYLTGDAFFFMSIYQVCIQLKMLSKMITYMDNEYMNFIHQGRSFKDEKINNRKNRTKTEQKTCTGIDHMNSCDYKIKLKECVLFHQILLWTMAEIEQLYRSMILADVLHAIISLSFAFLETGSSETIIDMIKMYFFLLICIVHQFLNSHYGQMLINAQDLVRESVYNSLWYTITPESRRYMILILARSTKFTIVNGGKMYNLCRASFVLFSKTLFSYYMFLRQVSG